MEYKGPCDRKVINSIVLNNISLLKKNINNLKNMNEEEINNIINESNKLYYLNGNCILSNEEYDIVCDYTINKYPNNNICLYGHKKLKITKDKIILPYEMWSMDKFKPNSVELNNWINKYQGPYVLSYKLDGVSALYTTEKNSSKLYTRGNGVIGHDISHLIPYLKLPKQKNIVIRGELIMNKEVFKNKYSIKYSNARNLVSGLVNNKSVNRVEYKDIEFVCYELIKPILKPSHQMIYLMKLDINVVTFRFDNLISNELLLLTLDNWRLNNKYEIDGLICVSDRLYERESRNPIYAFAYKSIIYDNIYQSEVLDVIWSASKDGYLKPRVKIKPIKIGGVNIEFATGFNGKYIKKNKIGIGSLINIIRSGDVIPHIYSIIKSSNEGLMPSIEYYWNETNIDIILKNKAENNEVKEKIITNFFKKIGVGGLSTGNVKRIMKLGFDTIEKILKMTYEDFLSIDGFKETLSNKIYKNIKIGIEETSIEVIMVATNIFGRGVGIKRLSLILKKYPNIIVRNETNEIKKINLCKINGISNNMAEKIINNIENFKLFMKKSNLEYKLNIKSSNCNIFDFTHELYGKTIVMSGFRNKELLFKFKEIGVKYSERLNKQTDMLIVKENIDTSKKVLEAKKIGINIINLYDFRTIYNV